MEVSALTHSRSVPGLQGPSPLLRLQSDERLIALTRRGQPAAFETLCTRYQSRLLSFCRHMLGSREDAHDVETAVPSVKALLVRARISLAEAAEARKLSCAEVRLELGEVAEGLSKLSLPARRHTRGCERCRFFKKQLKDNNHALAAMLPVGPLLLVKKLLLAKLGSTASASGAHVA